MSSSSSIGFFPGRQKSFLFREKRRIVVSHGNGQFRPPVSIIRRAKGREKWERTEGEKGKQDKQGKQKSGEIMEDGANKRAGKPLQNRVNNSGEITGHRASERESGILKSLREERVGTQLLVLSK